MAASRRFWSSFGINILEFISFSDVVKLAVYPLAVGALGFLLGLTFSNLFPRRAVQEGAQSNEPHGRINKYLRAAIWFGGMVFIAGLTSLFIRSDPFFWQAVGAVVAVILILTIKDVEPLKPIIPNQRVRSFVLAVGVSLLPLSFGVGKTEAGLIIKGRSVKVVSTRIFKEKGGEAFRNKGLLEGQESLKFVGVAGDYFFFLTMDNSTMYIVKYSALHFLELKSLK